MSELGPDHRALLDAAREADDPSMSASRERVRSALGRKLGIAAVGLGTATATSTATAGVATKIIIALAALGAVAGGVAVTRTTKPTPPLSLSPPSPSPSPSPISVSLPVPVSAAPSESLSSPPIPPPPPIVAPAAPPAAPSISAELSALQSANDKLAAHKPAEALAILDALPKSGALGEERAGLRLVARCALGQPAAEATRAFLNAHPASPLAARLRSSCGIE